MREKKQRMSDLGPLIPKNHFASMEYFRESPLIDWTFTKSILFTAYDVYRSSDFWIDSLLKKGLTLKEGLIELGFPKNNKIVADTGIFEIEARKAGIARDLGIEVNVELSNDQIFEAYQISGADFFVSPDEIVLATDNDSEAKSKIATIKSNMLELLEHIDSKSVIGVLQGIQSKYVSDLFDFFRGHGITKFAAGGVIPLYHYDKTMFNQTLVNVRKLTEGYWLHTFGLPRSFLIPIYIQRIGMDSVDTSMLYYMTARRNYLVGVNPRPIRLVSFQECNCPGCKRLNSSMNPRSLEFSIALYIHNVCEAAKVAEMCIKGEWDFQKGEVETETIEKIAKSEKSSKKTKDQESSWTSAYSLLNGES